MLWTKNRKILIACKTYQHRHVFYVATRRKVDIDNTSIEKTIYFRNSEKAPFFLWLLSAIAEVRGWEPVFAGQEFVGSNQTHIN